MAPSGMRHNEASQYVRSYELLVGRGFIDINCEKKKKEATTHFFFAVFGKLPCACFLQKEGPLIREWR